MLVCNLEDSTLWKMWGKAVTAINNLHLVSLVGLASWNVLELLWVVLLRMLGFDMSACDLTV